MPSVSYTHLDVYKRQHLLMLTAAAAGVAAAATAVPLVASFAPSQRALATGAAVEADISDLAPGAVKTVEWRGKPVWLLKRSKKMLDDLPSLKSQLLDPDSNEAAQQPKYALSLIHI